MGDWNSEKSVPSIEDLEPRLHISDIQTINTGTECDFVKDWKEKKSQFSDGKLAFSLMGENGTSLLGSILSLGVLVWALRIPFLEFFPTWFFIWLVYEKFF